ncbi:hypothetical protein GCM10008026_06200 [Chelatococcus composti]|nr:hypothetical protein GCM10008026_06200 [Chelatococcus composti]
MVNVLFGRHGTAAGVSSGSSVVGLLRRPLSAQARVPSRLSGAAKEKKKARKTKHVERAQRCGGGRRACHRRAGAGNDHGPFPSRSPSAPVALATYPDCF